MPDTDRPRLPQVEPYEARRRAEAYLGEGGAAVDLPRALAWGLLAVAGELHEIRKQMQRRR
jgi:hypothetical protein